MQTVLQLPDWLQLTLAVIPSLSAFFAAVGLFLTFQQSRRSAAQMRAKLVADFLKDFANDQSMQEIFYAIEYSKFKYDTTFHDSPLERDLDKVLVHFSNLALAWQAGLLADKDIKPVQYFARRLLRDPGVVAYLKFVDNWSDHAELGEHPYAVLKKMGIALGV